jgi:imidazolonepropionase-like amidohydrolase
LKMTRRRIAFCIGFVLILALPLVCQNPIAITHARILTGSNGVIEDGTVLVETGKIAGVGANVKLPAGAEIIDGRGKVVMPGMIDAGDQLGLVEIPFVHVTDDSNETTDPFHPELRVIDALNPQSENIRIARPAGITNAVVTPGGANVFAGQSAVIQLDGDTVSQMVVKSPAALHVNLDEESKATYGDKDRTPKTRMGTVALLRQSFLRAQHYQMERRAAPQSEERNLKMDALVAALNREIPVVIHANRVGDIDSALRLADEFNLRIVIAEGVAAWRLAPELARRNIPVIVGPVFQAPVRIEDIDMRLDNAALLNKAGVKIAVQTASVNGVRDLWFAMDYLIANGLPPDAALAAVTKNPAEIFGVQDRLGTIEVGRDADLIVLDGEPFRVKTHVLTVLIGGEKMDLSNHQTELFQKYKEKYEIH